MPSWLPLWFRRFWHWQVEQRWVMSRLNPKSIRPGHLYEGCDYHPMLCVKNDHGDLTGISLVDGQLKCCSAFHCGPFKLSLTEAEKARKKALQN